MRAQFDKNASAIREHLKSEIRQFRGIRAPESNAVDSSASMKLGDGMFTVAGHQVCSTFWFRLWGLSRTSYFRLCEEINNRDTGHGGMVVPRQTGVDPSTAALHEFIDSMADMCEVMPHVALQGDEETAMLELADPSQMRHTEQRFYPNMHTWSSMHDSYVQHINDKYKETDVVPRLYNQYKNVAQTRWPTCKLVVGAYAAPL